MSYLAVAGKAPAGRAGGVTFGPVGVGHALAVRPQESHLQVDVVHADPHVLRVLLQLHSEEGWDRGHRVRLGLSPDHCSSVVHCVQPVEGHLAPYLHLNPTF